MFFAQALHSTLMTIPAVIENEIKCSNIGYMCDAYNSSPQAPISLLLELIAAGYQNARFWSAVRTHL